MGRGGFVQCADAWVIFFLNRLIIIFFCFCDRDFKGAGALFLGGGRGVLFSGQVGIFGMSGACRKHQAYAYQQQWIE